VQQDRSRLVNWAATVSALALAVVATGLSCGPSKQTIILTPQHGEFTTASSIVVAGKIQGVAVNDADLLVKGTTVSINPDGTWSTVININPDDIFVPIRTRLLEISTGKTFINRIVIVHGESVVDGDFSYDSIALRLNDSGLDSIEPIVGQLVDLDIAALLPPGTTVISDFCAVDGGFLGCLGSVDVVIDTPAPSFSSFGLDVDSMTGFAAGDVTINDVLVHTHINGSGLAPSCGLDLSANSTTILGDYELEPDAADPSYIDVNLLGSPVIQFAGFDQNFTSGLCDFPLIGDLIQLIIGDVEPTVTQGLVNFLSDPDGSGPQDAPIAEGIETALANISIAGTISQGLGVMLDAPLFAVDEDPDGVTLGSDGRITADIGTGPGQCEAPDNAPDLPGSLSVYEPFPVFGPTTPVSGLPYGMALSISTAAFNQLLKAEVECGLLQMTLTELDLTGTGPQPLTAGLLSGLIPELGSLDPATPLQVKLIPTLAPVLTGNAGPQGELAELRVAALRIRLEKVGSENLLLSGQIDFRAGLDFSFDDLTGSLVPTIASVATSDITIAILKNKINTNAGNLVFFLKQLLPVVLPDLGDTLGAFPIPSFLGLQLQSVAVERSGAFLSLFVDLVPQP